MQWRKYAERIELVLVVEVVIEVVLGEVELEVRVVRVRVLDPSLFEAGIEVGFEWRRFLEE
ncbi:hypothetical protein ACLOJK_028807 [Asimina triloba]